MEIKKAFEQFKKELKKETGIEYGFTMNKRQIENRTATKTVCYSKSYDYMITFFEKQIEKVQAYTSWTDEEKANSKARDLERIAELKELKRKYGTRKNEAIAQLKAIETSKSFEHFKSKVGDTKINLEIDSEGFYKIRFNY